MHDKPAAQFRLTVVGAGGELLQRSHPQENGGLAQLRPKGRAD